MNSFFGGNIALTSNASGGSGVPQQFHTKPVANLQLATYQLQLRDSSGSLVDSFIFPLSPESVRKEYNTLANFYDVQGGVSNRGVQRVFDFYGSTPVTYLIEGTTGWKYHSSDGYLYTGLQAVSRIESLLKSFDTYNETLVEANNANLYELWFLDYFRNEYWSVVPVGPQGMRQSVSRPILVNYAFRWVGLRPLDSPEEVTTSDTLSQTLSISDTQSSQSLQSFGTTLNTDYSANTFPGQ